MSCLMKRAPVMQIGIALTLIIPSPSLSIPTSNENYTHFLWCEPLDYGGVHAAEGNWYYETWSNERISIPLGWKHGGSYITITKQINKSDFRSKVSGSLTATGIQLTEINGNPIEGFFLPLRIRDAVCN